MQKTKLQTYDSYFSKNFLVSFSKLFVSCLPLVSSISEFSLFAKFISFLYCKILAMLNTSQNKSVYIMQHHLYLHVQKKNNTVKFFLNAADFICFNLFFDFYYDNLNQFSKLSTILKSSAENSFILQFS